MGTNRLTAIFLHILNRNALTAPALAKRFNVMPGAIVKDLDTLKKAGLPLMTAYHETPSGQVFTSYSLQKDQLSAEELSHIFHQLMVSSSLPAVPMAAEGDFASLIENAIALEWPLALTYIDANNSLTQRTIEPITFTWENHDGYLYAYCRLREDFRHFKFSGIQRLTLVEGSFTHHLDPLEDWNEDWEDDWEEEDSSEPYYDIVFSCTEDLLGEVFLSFDEEVEVLKESAGGRYLLSVYAPFSPMVLGFFMGFGQKLKVLTPQEFKSLLKQKAQEVLKLY